MKEAAVGYWLLAVGEGKAVRTTRDERRTTMREL
jgi:hypothetical protein